MKKLFLGKPTLFFYIFLLLNSNLIARERIKNINKDYSNGTCTVLFKEYDIDPEVRSPKGWYRIYKEGALTNYLHIHYLSTKNEKKLSDCLINNGFKIEKYQRSIGDKKNKSSIIQNRKENNYEDN